MLLSANPEGDEVDEEDHTNTPCGERQDALDHPRTTTRIAAVLEQGSCSAENAAKDQPDSEHQFSAHCIV